MTLELEKQRAQRQWTDNPCGYLQEQGYPHAEYFTAVDASRYEDYAPWMPAAFGFDSHADQDVLELGFGQGTDLFQFARHGARVTGLDLSPKHLEIASTRFSQAQIPARLMLGDAEQMPLKSDCFDHVHSFGVLHHSPDMPRALAEVRRVLRPGGTFNIGLYSRYSAFHLFAKLLSQGLLQRELFRRGYDYVMATVEVGGGETMPLVRTYSKRGLKKLFAGFEGLEFPIHHLDPAHFGALTTRLRLDPERIRRWEGRLGWYILAKGHKPK